MLCNAIIYLCNDNKGDDKRLLIGNKKSVRQSEFYQAMQANLKAELMVEIRTSEYKGEEYLWYKNVNYKILRTYDRPDEWTEIVARKF